MQCVLYERVDEAVLTRMSQLTLEQYHALKPNKTDIQVMFERIQSYINRMLRRKGQMAITYKFAANATNGRLNAPLGIQPLPTIIRGALFRDTTTDIDICNCHPAILLHLCTKYKVHCDSLRRYVERRQEVFDEIGDAVPNAKKILLTCIFKEERNISMIELYASDKRVKFICDFDENMKVLQQELSKQEELVKLVTVPAAKTKNRKGSFLSRVCQVYENECLQKMITYFNEKGIEVAVLMFDGLMVYGNYYGNQQILDDLKERLSEFNLTVAYKEHCQLVRHTQFAEVTPDPATDAEAADRLLMAYPFWKCDGGRLFMFDKNTGMWTTDIHVQCNCVTRHRDVLGKYGQSVALIRNVISMIKMSTRVIHMGWFTDVENTSIGYLLFNNGYYNFHTGEFIPEFTEEIYFFYKLRYNYVEHSADDHEFNAYMASVKRRFFTDQHGEEVGSYLLETFARAIAGEQMKTIFFGLGTGDTGKSFFIKMFESVFEEYVATFNANNLALSLRNTDEAAKLRWVLNFVHKRIAFSSEISQKSGSKTAARLDGALMKSLSGNDVIMARDHFESERAIKPHFFMAVLANDLPEIDPNDEAMQNRTLVASFLKRYVAHPLAANQLQRDPGIEEEMRTIEFKLAMVQLFMNAFKGQRLERPAIMTTYKEEWIPVPNPNVVLDEMLVITENAMDRVPLVDVYREVFDCRDESDYIKHLKSIKTWYTNKTGKRLTVKAGTTLIGFKLITQTFMS